MSRRLAATLATLALTFTAWLAAAAPASAGGACGEPLEDARAVSVDAKQNCFLATVTRVDVGATVTWTNWDDVAHTVSGAGGSFGGGDLQPRASLSYRFERPGVYPYFCHFHPGMVGAVVVGDGSAPVAATATTPERPVTRSRATVAATVTTVPPGRLRAAVSAGGPVRAKGAGGLVAAAGLALGVGYVAGRSRRPSRRG